MLGPARVAAAACALLSTAATGAPVFIPADDPRIFWIGRYVLPGDGSVIADWEGVEARFIAQGAENVKMLLNEGNGGGNRWAVYLNNSDTTVLTKITTFWSSPQDSNGTGTLYPVVGGWNMGKQPFEVRVQRTQEPTFSGAAWSSPSRVLGFQLDTGSLLPYPAPATPRRIEFIGDSITAAYGCYGTLASGCNGGPFNSDFSDSYANVLCLALGAQCSTLAWSGISLVDPRTGPGLPPCPARPAWGSSACVLPDLYPYAMANQQYKTYPYAFPAVSKPQAVHINLGTNDARLNSFSNATFAGLYTAAYVAFVQAISAAWQDAQTQSIHYFLAYGPMSTAYNASLQQAAATLSGQGFKVTPLDYTLADYGPNTVGCNWHPTIALHQEMASKNLPVIQQAMGW